MAAANLEAVMRGMTEARRAAPGNAFMAKYGIVAGAAIVGMLAGIGITAADYPWHLTARTPPTRDMERGRAAVALAPKTAPKAIPKAAPVAAPRAAPETAAATVDPKTPVAAPAATKAAEKVQPPPVRKVAKRKSAKKSAAEAVADRPPRNASRPQSVDARYVREITKCKSGLTGLPCREAAKWRLCAGRWSIERHAGETRCYIGRD